MQDTPDASTRGSRGNPLMWLLLATFSALLPALGLEAWIDRAPDFWEEARATTDVRTDARQGLRLEANLRNLTQTEQAAPRVLLLGNSLMSENVDADALQGCCGPVEKLGNNGLTLLETAMLGQWLVEIQPELVVLALTELDVYRSAGWDGLRFYEPETADRLSTRFDMIQHSSAHLRGHVQRHFTLFRHRQAILEVSGSSWGLPLQEMLEVVPNTCLVYSEVEPRPLPTVQTRALGQLAGRLRDADIGLLVFGSPVRSGGTRPDAALKDRTHDMDVHLDDLARTFGFKYVPAGLLSPIDKAVYKDALHLMPEGRALLTQRLTPHIVALLEPAGVE